MRRIFSFSALGALFFTGPLWAQTPSSAVISSSSTATSSNAISTSAATPPVVASSAPVSSSPQAATNGLGTPLSLDTKGPWVIGEVLFIRGGKFTNDYTLTELTHATKGSLYTEQDIQDDVKRMEATGQFSAVVPNLYEMPTRVPSQLSTIAVVGREVRLVYKLAEKNPGAGPVSSTPKKPVTEAKQLRVAPPAPLSGVVFTPTAYRGHDQDNSPGLGLDINADYIIGRLYGKNSFKNSPAKTNYLDQVGVWMLSADGKMQLQSETNIRPAVAFGTQGTLLFRDTSQPTASGAGSTNVTAQVSNNNGTQMLGDAYFVMTKKIYFVRLSAGMMFGDWGDAVAQFSNFLSPTALTFYAQDPNQTVMSHTVPFVNAIFMATSNHPIELEAMQFNGAALHPMLINLKASHYLKTDFNLGFLKFSGGYDLLGTIAVRYNFWPR